MDLFEKISNWVKIEFDTETWQYSIINDNTPWIFWIWDSLQEAVSEYLSSLWDLILINNAKQYGAKTFA
jgi:hypothetical protein